MRNSSTSWNATLLNIFIRLNRFMICSMLFFSKQYSKHFFTEKANGAWLSSAVYIKRAIMEISMSSNITTAKAEKFMKNIFKTLNLSLGTSAASKIL